MLFEELLVRADESTLQEILGAQAIRLLTTLDETRSYNRYLRQIILNLYGPDGLLLDRKYRALLIDLLPENEARDLAVRLGISSNDTGEVYRQLRELSVRRGSSREENLFRFFGVHPPEIAVKLTAPNPIQVEGRYQLFRHQRDAARRICERLELEPYRVLLHMPTGSGKTRVAMSVIAGHLCHKEPTVVVWLATSEELCEQAAEEFEKAWSHLGNRPIQVHRFWGNYSLSSKALSDGLVVAGLPKMVSTVKGSDGISFVSTLASKTTLVVMDEAHQAIAPTYRLILDTLFHAGHEQRLLGLSATPGRSWNNVVADEELADFFGRNKVRLEVDGYTNPIDYLVDEGYLARVKYRRLYHGNGLLSSCDLEEIRDSIDVPISILKTLGQDEQRNLKIIYETERLATEHKRILVFAPSVESSDLLACVLQARGFDAQSITGETPSIKRRSSIAGFREDPLEVKILCNYGVLTTGFDAPKTSAAVIARPTFSLVLYSQMIGRAIRGVRAGGNREAEVVTVVDRQLPGFRTVAEAFDNWEDVW